MSIWDDDTVDWTTGDGLSARQLFERAYPDDAAIRTITERVSIDITPDPPGSGVPSWTRILQRAAANGQMLDLAAEMLEDTTRAWFAKPLTDLLGGQLPLANARRIRRHGLPVNETSRNALINSILPAANGDATALVQALAVASASGDDGDVGFGLQSITVPQAGIEDLASAFAVLVDASRRMALIKRNKIHLGSGFLVGTDLLLTAAHVADEGGTGCVDADGLVAVFDFHNLDPPPKSQGETGFPVPIAGVLCESPPTTDERASKAVANWDAPMDKLDFALLKLSQPVAVAPPATSRGFYRLDPQPINLGLLPPSEVFHFPLGGFLGRSPILGKFVSSVSGTRIRYTSNTLVGSSGGAVIDRRGNLIALHHYSIATQNQAVPIWLIAEVLTNRGLLPAELGPGPGPAGPAPAGAIQPLVAPAASTKDPYLALRVGPRPIVDRQRLRRTLQNMVEEQGGLGQRALKISGNTDTGVSWSYWLLNHLESQSRWVPTLQATAPEGWRVIKVDLREIVTTSVEETRHELVRQILDELPGDIDDESIAQAARNITRFKRRCRDAILGSDQLWWIFVDSVDEPGEWPLNSVHEILHALLDLADEQQLRLRLVLAGRKVDDVEHDALSWAADDQPSGLLREEVKNWISDRVDQSGRQVNAAALTAFLDKWFPGVDVAPNPEQLALVLENAVKEVAA
jgi:Trypsin-like peptidase domain